MKHPIISGLSYYSDFISPEEANSLVAQIDSLPWMDDLRRRVQHYGWKYDYTARRIDQSMKIGPLPEWAQSISQRIYSLGITPALSDQLIINEYVKNQSISRHVDCVPCFKDGVSSLSLLEEWEMIFTHTKTGEKVSVMLAPGSLVVLTGAARYEWTHEIPKRLKEPTGLLRERRLSLTFRSVII